MRSEQMTQSAERERPRTQQSAQWWSFPSESSTSNPVLLAGVGLKIERDVGGRGFRIAGVASDGPGESFRLRLHTADLHLTGFQM